MSEDNTCRLFLPVSATSHLFATPFSSVQFILNDHQRRCTKETKSNLTWNEAVQGGRLLLQITDEENTSFFMHVVNSMNDDEVAKLARNDKPSESGNGRKRT